MIRSTTDPRWLRCALEQFDALLVDHAHCEQKAAASAMSLVAAYPTHDLVVRRLSALAIEELRHFRAVHEHVRTRGLALGHPGPDPYARALIALARDPRDERFVDRLLVSALIEARSHERLALLAENLEDVELSEFYAGLARAERGHAQLFVDLASTDDTRPQVEARLEELAIQEAEIVAALPIAPPIH